MAEYILEIGLEEMPAGFIDGALKDAKKNAETLFEKERLTFESINCYATPRRLVVNVKGLEELQRDLSEEVKGPSVKAAYKDGVAAKPLEGFLRANGFTEEDVYTKELPNGSYVFCKREAKGGRTVDILSAVMAEFILGLKFPKTMKWGACDLKYIRPIRWVVSLFDDQVVPFEVGEISANRYTRGHRTLGHEKVEIASSADYFKTMEEEFVIVDQVKRREMIDLQIADIFSDNDDYYQEDSSLMNEIVNLVEYPTALRGDFDTKYLQLPIELVVTPMKEHQRYFPVMKKDGSLTNSFITVRNGNKEYLDIVREGNANVLRARLADAEFFYQEDIKKGLEYGESKLKDIVFQEKLGTISDKVERLQYISSEIAKLIGGSDELAADVVTAAKYCKLDLVSNAVSEFPELQGIMGEYYFNHQYPAKPNVGRAIKEHYMPRFANDNLPGTVEGSIVSIADKLDTLVGCYYAGIVPTGSQDPYALRRQALGLANIIIDNKWSLSIRSLIDIACKAYALTDKKFNEDAVNQKIYEFFEQRILKIMKDKNYSADIIQAVIQKGYDNLYETIIKADALTDVMNSTDKDVLKRTLDNAGRAMNITEKVHLTSVEQSRFVSDEERYLYEAILNSKRHVAAALAEKNFSDILHEFIALNDVVETFFENILVMDENEDVRNNRLSLVKVYANIIDEFYKINECKLA